MKTCKELNVTIFLLAPYSYLMQPIEMLFGILKSMDINPDNHPTSKK